jgi:hypothetical protein
MAIRGSWLLAGVAAVALAAVLGTTPHASSLPGPVVDSALPRALELARFRAGTDSMVALSGGAGSLHDLATRWTAAIAASDTITLRALVIDRAEFGWLFYPSSAQGRPPYDLSPALMWDLLGRQTDAGIGYLRRALDGRPLGAGGVDCGVEPMREGANRIWGPCFMTLVLANGDSLAARLTGPVIERDGRFKFVSYTNDLD